MTTRPILHFFCFSRVNYKHILQPSEIVDILKGTIIVICCIILSHVDMAMMYHLIKSQSVIKLYIFYNMLETGDRLFSVFGQDIVDALFWTATERKGRKREHLVLHTVLVLLQATTLNVAINSSNKALLTIMMSNNFVELKSSVFKKFDKNNLFQLSCSDVRERFHLSILLLVVVIQTMREYMWKEERFWVLIPDCLMVILAEVIVDWVKHAFITRFNDIPSNIYQEFTLSLAYDLAATKQKHAFTDHSDLVARRMGFIPLPLGVLAIRIVSQAVQITDYGDAFILFLAFLCLGSFRILCNIITLGKACDLIDTHQKQRASAAAAAGLGSIVAASTSGSASPRASRPEKRNSASEDRDIVPKNESFPEPVGLFTRSMSIDESQLSQLNSAPKPMDADILAFPVKFRSASHSPPRRSVIQRRGSRRMRMGTPPQIPPLIPELGQPIFSNSTVSLTSICLNEEIYDEDEQTLTESNAK
ncbi:hypothetical protein GHT06_010369 [Daphnia sinensis]|uniref:Protein TAPT1 homolog n=1 Tax=Daphnia sinensis TaxID=1820382 RepID=A0AAD5LIG7_9CRUS|nr:hypothetical protein GHT06_010369 [Daphnia sinensis]